MEIFGNIRIYSALILTIIIHCLYNPATAQVEHNYEVGPQSANCDTLNLRTSTLREAVSVIEHATFRYQQQFKISRTYGIMSARFYSCDGNSGYLIMKVDKRDILYFEVPQPVWKELISSADINGFYDAEIKGNYDFIKEEGLE